MRSQTIGSQNRPIRINHTPLRHSRRKAPKFVRAFVAGASGMLGHAVVRLLIKNNIVVIAASGSNAEDDLLRSQGIEPRRGDLQSAESVREVSGDCDLFLNLPTDNSTGLGIRSGARKTNDRVRQDQTRAMLEAAVANKCQLYIQPSTTDLYGDHQGEWVDEETMISPNQPNLLRAAYEMEQMIFEARANKGLSTIIPRMGTLYSSESGQTQNLFRLAKSLRIPMFQKGEAYYNTIEVGDAAWAIMSIIKNRTHTNPPVVNVCDNHPAKMRDIMNVLAARLNGGKPINLPTWTGRLLLGNASMPVVLSSNRSKNQLVKQVYGWTPTFTNTLQGLEQECGRWIACRALRSDKFAGHRVPVHA